MQNMLVMRFANRFLGPMWNNVHISNIQVSWATVLSTSHSRNDADRHITGQGRSLAKQKTMHVFLGFRWQHHDINWGCFCSGCLRLPVSRAWCFYLACLLCLHVQICTRRSAWLHVHQCLWWLPCTVLRIMSVTMCISCCCIFAWLIIQQCLLHMACLLWGSAFPQAATDPYEHML